MKRWIIGTGMAVLTLVALSGCGSVGTASGGQQALTGYTAVIRVVDSETNKPLTDVEVYYITDGGQLPWQRVVASSTVNQKEVALNIARTVKEDLREGDFLLLNIPDTLSVRGIWIRRPSGYTAVARHTTPEKIQRTIQLPDEPNTSSGCLIASDKQGVIRDVFGAQRVIDFGKVELFPDRPGTPPPPVDDLCP